MISSLVIEPGTMVIGTRSSASRRPVSALTSGARAALVDAGAEHQHADLGVGLDVLDHRVDLVALADRRASG